MLLSTHRTIYDSKISYKPRVYKLQDQYLGIAIRRYCSDPSLGPYTVTLFWHDMQSPFSKLARGPRFFHAGRFGLERAFLGC